MKTHQYLELGTIMHYRRQSDPPRLIPVRVVGVNLASDDSIRYSIRSVNVPERGIMTDVRPEYLEPPKFQVGDVVLGAAGTLMSGRGPLIVRRLNRPGVWTLEVEDTEGRRVPASESELTHVPGDVPAPGHNPDGLTLGQVGRGFRLAPEGHVGACELWARGYGAGGYWFPMFDPRCRPLPNRTYRIKW